ncbi:MAG: signal peptidase II [Candidatus Omnitrophota bacterium]
MSRTSGKISAQVITGYCIVFVMLLSDQLSKFLIMRLVPHENSVPVVSNVFHITLIYNTGAAFGILKGHPVFFTAVSVLAVIIINYFILFKQRVLTGGEKAALYMILAGTSGNLIDRLRFGYVVDFFDFRIWPVFNMADSFITIGAFLLGWSLFYGNSARRAAPGSKEVKEAADKNA